MTWVTFFVQGDQRLGVSDRPHDGGGRIIVLHVDEQALSLHFPPDDDGAVVIATNRLIEALSEINRAAQDRILAAETVPA